MSCAFNCSGAIAVTSQLFGEESLPTHITNVDCIGSEQSLLECNSTSANSDFSCSSERDDAGVVCQGIEAIRLCVIKQMNLIFILFL